MNVQVHNLNTAHHKIQDLTTESINSLQALGNREDDRDIALETNSSVIKAITNLKFGVLLSIATELDLDWALLSAFEDIEADTLNQYRVQLDFCHGQWVLGLHGTGDGIPNGGSEIALGTLTSNDINDKIGRAHV